MAIIAEFVGALVLIGLLVGGIAYAIDAFKKGSGTHE